MLSVSLHISPCTWLLPFRLYTSTLQLLLLIFLLLSLYARSVRLGCWRVSRGRPHPYGMLTLCVRSRYSTTRPVGDRHSVGLESWSRSSHGISSWSASITLQSQRRHHRLRHHRRHISFLSSIFAVSFGDRFR